MVGHLSGFVHYSGPIPTYMPGWGGGVGGQSLLWLVYYSFGMYGLFYILKIDMYERLYCNRQLPGNECVSSIIVIIQFSPVSYINKINNLFVLEIQM